MFFDSGTLFFFAGLLYLIIFIALLLKKRATLRGQAAFLCIYAGSVFWLSIYCFPLDLTYMHQRKGWSLLPFGNIVPMIQAKTSAAQSMLFSVFRYLLVAFLLSVIFGFCFCLLARKVSFGGIVLKTMILLVVLQVLGLLCTLWGYSFEHPFDTSVLLVDLLGAALGFFCFQFLKKRKIRRRSQA